MKLMLKSENLLKLISFTVDRNQSWLLPTYLFVVIPKSIDFKSQNTKLL